MYEKLAAVLFKKLDVLCSVLVSDPRRISTIKHTFGDLEVGDSLPLVHSHEPSLVLLPTTEINDKIVFAVFESFEKEIQTRSRE